MFNRLSVAAAAVSIALVTGPARGQEPDAGVRAMNNFHYEMAECIAFYQSVAKCAANSGSKGAHVSEQSEKAAETMLLYYSHFGETLEITNDAARSRLLLSAQEMMKLISSNCINLSSLLTRYLDKCVAISNDPTKVLKERVARAK